MHKSVTQIIYIGPLPEAVWHKSYVTQIIYLGPLPTARAPESVCLRACLRVVVHIFLCQPGGAYYCNKAPGSGNDCKLWNLNVLAVDIFCCPTKKQLPQNESKTQGSCIPIIYSSIIWQIYFWLTSAGSRTKSSVPWTIKDSFVKNSDVDPKASNQVSWYCILRL